MPGILTALCGDGLVRPRLLEETRFVAPLRWPYGTLRLFAESRARARNGKMAHLVAHGVSDLGTKKPMQTETIFRIASMGFLPSASLSRSV